MRASARRSGWNGSFPTRASSNRHHGRVTKEDIRSAGLRRWDGRARVTTDWLSLFQDPELCFPTGDIMIYLREPGQSSRGPAFRVHRERLQAKGFDAILTKCVERAPVLRSGTCMAATSCSGCEQHLPTSELYIPAPPAADLDTIFDHHITTRNFFAWLYNLPLAGRSLGHSLVALRERIDFYRPGTAATTSLEVVSFAESQRYLDFRECVDHALAALLLAETLQLEDLWVDAFAHCVGMADRGMQESIEYFALSEETKAALRKCRLELEGRLERVSKAVEHFFEYSLSRNSLGLPTTAREHFDRFRSWLHSFYIEQHGFWPPIAFVDDEAVQRKIYATMYSDFKNLYHHLADPNSADVEFETSLSGSGGVCTLQNIQTYDRKYHYDPLPSPLPMLPVEPSSTAKRFGLQRRKSWNPITKRKIEKDNRNAMRVQALITSSNRDWSIMECLLVRRYSEFEIRSVADELETISMVDGRKVRWIVIYAILQTLVSVMQSPRQVRNTDGLTYSLCCRPPSIMPWLLHEEPIPVALPQKRQSNIEPDVDLLKKTSMTDLASASAQSSTTKKDRRLSLPTRISSIAQREDGGGTTTRTLSLRRFVSKRNSNIPDVPALPKQAAFHEILVQGYGNGLNEVNKISTPTSATFNLNPEEAINTEKSSEKGPLNQDDTTRTVDTSLPSPTSDVMPELTPASSNSVSRESSNASNKATGPKTNDSSSDNNEATERKAESLKSTTSIQDLVAASRVEQAILHPPLPSTEFAALRVHQRIESKDLNKILDENGFSQTLHMNTATWDQVLSMA